jgi:hypothetical protein
VKNIYSQAIKLLRPITAGDYEPMRTNFERKQDGLKILNQQKTNIIARFYEAVENEKDENGNHMSTKRIKKAIEHAVEVATPCDSLEEEKGRQKTLEILHRFKLDGKIFGLGVSSALWVELVEILNQIQQLEQSSTTNDMILSILANEIAFCL